MEGASEVSEGVAARFPQADFFLRTLAAVFHSRSMTHISDHDLERFYVGLVKDDAELAMLEEHLLTCSDCIDAAEGMARYVDTLRAAIIVGNFDLE
jgi:hypothetical protein